MRGSSARVGLARRRATTPVLADAEYALQLQLEEAGAGRLSPRALAALAAGLDPPPRRDADFILAAQLRLRAAGAGDVAVETIAAVAAPDEDADTARRVYDAQHAVANDVAFGEKVAQSHDLATDPDSKEPANISRSGQSVVGGGGGDDGGTSSDVVCPVCLEHCPSSMIVVLGDCRHEICSPCARKYIETIAQERTTFPVPCPSCRGELDPLSCLATLAGTGEPFALFEKFVVEKMYMKHVRYCPNERCAQAFDWCDDEDFKHFEDRFKVLCSFCSTEFCVECKVPWHEGKSCEAYHAEKMGDDALLKLAKVNKWTPCPECGELIEKRIGDCHYVRCRCGIGFCHGCGVSYRSDMATSRNTHGTPDCLCGLWPYDEDPSDGEDVLAPPANEQGEALFGPREPARVVRNFEPPRRVAPALLWEPPGARQMEHDDLDPPVREVDIDTLVRECGAGIRRLPNGLLRDLREMRCPHPLCARQFATMRSLDQHLMFTETHPVYICCRRPFASEHSFEQHRRSRRVLHF
jgi:IBR domain, a half RING-finger domain